MTLTFKLVSMKTCISIMLIFCSLSIYGQNSVAFEKVVLDGKPAFINVVTGEIVSEIPTKSSISAVSNKPLVSSTSSTSNTHVIAKGETLYAISRKYGVSVQKLTQLNPAIDFNALSIDQRIIIRENTNEVAILDATSTDYHVVEKGETLYAISRKYNISVSDLKSKNNLSSSVLSIGQNLIVKQ